MRIILNFFAAIVLTCLSAGNVKAQSLTSDFGNSGVITIQSLKRSGNDSVVLKATIQNQGNERIDISELLAPSKDGQRFFAALQDPTAKKQYQQVTIDNDPVGSVHSGYTNESLQPQQKIPVWARITAPPPEVEKITVIFKGTAQPVEDVPIQR